MKNRCVGFRIFWSKNKIYSNKNPFLVENKNSIFYHIQEVDTTKSQLKSRKAVQLSAIKFNPF